MSDNPSITPSKERNMFIIVWDCSGNLSSLFGIVRDSLIIVWAPHDFHHPWHNPLHMVDFLPWHPHRHNRHFRQNPLLFWECSSLLGDWSALIAVVHHCSGLFNIVRGLFGLVRRCSGAVRACSGLLEDLRGTFEDFSMIWPFPWRPPGHDLFLHLSL